MTVEDLAYLKCPHKIRAALINAGERALSVDLIAERLAKMPKKRDEYMRQYHFPKAVKNLRRKMQVLEDEAAAVGHREYLRCLKAANEAWEREVKLAKLQAELREEVIAEMATRRDGNA